MVLLLRSDNGWSAISPENRDPLFRIALKTLKFEGAQAPKKEARPKDRAHLTRCGAIYSGIAKKQWVVEWIPPPTKDCLAKLSQFGGFCPILPARGRIGARAAVMRKQNRADIAEIRSIFAGLMAAASGSADPRLERAFELVPREVFMGPGPWRIGVYRKYLETPDADPAYLYQNVLVALDADKGINNGEPFLHAMWIGAVSPKAGDTVCHIGAGTGYYTAILSVLTLPGGAVHAFEIEEGLAEKARENLRPFEGIAVVTGDATKLPLPPSDLIYVNAGGVAPPPSWLKALRPQGRMIFPWRPSLDVGLAIIISRQASGFSVKPLMNSYFIPCVGASEAGQCMKTPDEREAWSARSVWLSDEREPDETAVAICEHLWFSSAEIPAEA
jgi:protein-L-isoaspartate(D-aspartate) O-methyltransferase